MTELDSRLVDLELRFMKLERFTHELSDVVADQRREIDALRAQMIEMKGAETNRLRDRLLEGRESPSDESSDKPPHY
jgi:uncharacterized coiled-coil protein SlyX